MAALPTWIKNEYAFPGTIKRGDRGNKVRFAQEWLSLNGIQVVADGIFGPASEQALREFQDANDLKTTGTANKKTLEALTAPLQRALKPIPLQDRSFAELVIAYAKQHLAEHPREVGGQNLGPWVRLYMQGHEGHDFPWCAGFVSFIAKEAARTFDTKLEIPYTFSCDVIAVEGQHRNRFISEKEARAMPKSNLTAGSVFLNRRTPTDWIHTGLVIKFNEETFETIEGNTNDEGSREGFEVCRRIRGYKDKDFIRMS
ncbi:MAG: peptidoglycan-binding protein [Rhodothermales bacterium]